jgi:methionyl-tRNA synthetase
MVERYFDGAIPQNRQAEESDQGLIDMLNKLRAGVESHMDKLSPQSALMDIFAVISRANKYIDENSPWLLIKDEASHPRLAQVLYNLLEAIRVSAILLNAFIPESCETILAQIGQDAAQLESLKPPATGPTSTMTPLKRPATCSPASTCKRSWPSWTA